MTLPAVMLEDVVTEFDIQGLELDYAVVAWDADYRYVDGEWTYNNFVGNRWNNVSSDDRRLYLKTLTVYCLPAPVRAWPSSCQQAVTTIRPANVNGMTEYMGI